MPSIPSEILPLIKALLIYLGVDFEEELTYSLLSLFGFLPILFPGSKELVFLPFKELEPG